MISKKVFNILFYLFIITVPLVPFKAKIAFVPFSADFVIGGLLILVGLLYLVKSKDVRISARKILQRREIRFMNHSILPFIFLSFFSITYAVSKGSVVSESIRFLEYVFIFYLVIFISDAVVIRKGFRTFYIIMLLACGVGVYQFVFNTSHFLVPYMPLSRGRVFGTFENPNYWGAAVNMIIFYPILSIIQNKGKRIIHHIAALVLIAFNLVFNFSRGSWLGFAFGLLLIVVVKYRRSLWWILLLLTGGAALPPIRDRLVSLLTMRAVTSMERVKLWTAGWYMFKEHLWLGVGSGNFGEHYGNYTKRFPELFIADELSSVHNSFLKEFAELGILGGILFAVIFLGLVIITFKVYKEVQNKHHKIIALSMLGFLGAYFLQNFMNNLMFIPQLNVFMWVAIAMLYKGLLIDKVEVE